MARDKDQQKRDNPSKKYCVMEIMVIENWFICRILVAIQIGRWQWQER